MDKLLENVKKELKQIEANGLSSSNLDTAYKLVSMGKNILKMEKEEGERQMRDHYMGDDYGARRYRGGEYDAYVEGCYGRRGVPGSGRGRYRDHGQDRFYDHMNRIEDGMDMYLYGKERYYSDGDKSRMHEGLDKMMYGICMFVESAMDFAETPEEKELVRKHIQKLKAI